MVLQDNNIISVLNLLSNSQNTIGFLSSASISPHNSTDSELLLMMDSMQCNSANASSSSFSRFGERKSWHEMMDHVFKALSYDDIVGSAAFPEEDNNLPPIDVELFREPAVNKENEASTDEVDEDSSSIHPTPINRREHLTIVKEIKLGSWWNHNDDDLYSPELLKKLLLDRHDHRPPETELDEATSSIKSATEAPTSVATSQDTCKVGSSSDDIDDDDESSSSSINIDHQVTDGGDKWNERFHELLKFREENGNTLVPYNWSSDQSLARWVKRQRYQFKLKCEGKHSTLSDARMKILKRVGFIWSRHSAGWEERYNELAEFARLYGHCNVPSTYSTNPQLSIWVRVQRRQYKLRQCHGRRNTMTRERITRLNQLGFVFNPRNIMY